MNRTASAPPAKYTRHPVFDRFQCWEGEVPQGLLVNFLGVTTKASLWSPQFPVLEQFPRNPAERSVKTEYPGFNEEYFEWTDLLEAVTSAQRQFVMLELGAGWGRWSANAVAALRQSNDIPYTLLLVEAEPSHFLWMIDHLRDNGIDLSRCQFIEAAVAAQDGTVGFKVDRDPANCYGQAIGGSTKVAAVSLNTLLRPLERVDLIDIDVQGAELEVLAAADAALDEKVKKVHIGTHGPGIEQGLRSLFNRLGWNSVYDFPGTTSVDTRWGTISFQDGVQSWINPAHCPGAEDPAAILTEKLRRSRQEAARLWSELGQLRNQATPRRPRFAQKLMASARRLRERFTPNRTPPR